MPQTRLWTAGLGAVTEKERRLTASRANRRSSPKNTLMRRGLRVGPRHRARRRGNGSEGDEKSLVRTGLTEVTGDTGGRQLAPRVHFPRVSLTDSETPADPPLSSASLRTRTGSASLTRRRLRR